jgi:hypothetical protein
VIAVVVVCGTVVIVWDVGINVDVVCGTVVIVWDVGIDVDVVCGTVVIVWDVGIDVTVVIVVVAGSDVVTVVVSSFFGTRMANFNTSERVTARIVRITKVMQMILNQRRCHHLYGQLFSMPLSMSNSL